MRKILLLNAMLAISYFSFGQMTADEAVTAMGRAINMGNTLDATNYEGGWGTEAREYYFDMYKEAGFSTVRIPITWDKRVATEAPYTIDEDFAKRVDTILGWCLDRDLIAIINVHHDEWIKYTETFDEQKPRFYAIWEQLAERYKDYPEHLFFEIINEPHHDNGSLTTAQVDELNSEGLDIIRAKNPTRIVLYGGPGWSSSNDLFDAAVPDTDDEYLMAYYHSYDPWNFAGEGNGTWGSEADKTEMTDQMQRVKEWSEENSVPVLIGEYGAVKQCDYDSRMRYYAHYSEHALAHGLVPAVWDDDGNFQVLQRVDTSWNEIKDVLIYSSDSSIINVETSIFEDTVIEIVWESRASTDPVAIIERKSLTADFAPIGSAGQVSGTIFHDKTAEVGVEYSYRIVEQFDAMNIPSYPQSGYLLPTERTPYHGVAFAIPGTIEAEDYDIGGQFLTYFDTEPENIPGAYRPNEAVDIEERPDGGFQVGYVAEGEWIEYTIDVEEAGDYTIIGHFATPNTGCVLGFEIDEKKVGEIKIPNTGSWTDLLTASSKLTLEAGEQYLRINILSEDPFNIDKFEISKGYNPSISELTHTLSIYPNPVVDQLFIELEGDQTIQKVEVLDLNGRTIDVQTGVSNKMTVYTSEYNQGLYILNVTTQNQVITKKFMVK